MNTSANLLVVRRLRFPWAASLFVCLLLVVVARGAPALAQDQQPQITTSIVSVSSSGALSDGLTDDVAVSADGRYIAFASRGTNLVNGDTNHGSDIFVRDTLEDTTVRVSVGKNGAQANAKSYDASISYDGQVIAFTSHATNLLGNTREADKAYRGPGINVYAHDRNTGKTELISRSTSGTPADRHAWLPDVSPDGGFVGFSSHSDILVQPDKNGIKRDAFVRDRARERTSYAGVLANGDNPWSGSSYSSMAADGLFVAFQSKAPNLVPGDTNMQFDIFVLDRTSGQTTRVSVASDGTQGRLRSRDADISPDGRYVVFATLSVLDDDDRNGFNDVYLHDRTTGETTLISVSTNDNPGNGDSTKPSISADGRYISFLSMADNFASNDHNDLQDVYLHDRETDQTVLVSVDLQGNAGGGRVMTQELSADGHVVVFISAANDLVAGDNNGWPDAFMAVVDWEP